MARHRVFVISCLIFALGGCAGHDMALTKGQTDIDGTQQAIALISARISNRYKPEYQLDIVTTYICPSSQADCSNSADCIYKTGSDNRIQSIEEGYNEYLLSFALKSGTYNLDSMGAIHQSVLVTGGGIVPLKFHLDIRPHSVIYLGHLDIVMRERKSEAEVRAGRMYPLVDQAAIGTSSGTFDVVVEDRFEDDVKLFLSEYPALKKVSIEKALLPQWTRPKNETSD